MRLTDAQYSEIRRLIQTSLSNSTIDELANYLAPLFAAEMLGPITNEERIQHEWSRGSYPVEAVRRILASRLAKYAPKPVDPAIEAVWKYMVDEGKTRRHVTLEDVSKIVAAVDKARAK